MNADHKARFTALFGTVHDDINEALAQAGMRMAQDYNAKSYEAFAGLLREALPGLEDKEARERTQAFVALLMAAAEYLNAAERYALHVMHEYAGNELKPKRDKS